MNKLKEEQYRQIIDEKYENYWNSVETSEYDGFGSTSIKLPVLTQEEFINKCKTNPEFSEKWGLKIEERELSYNERMKLLEKIHPLYYMEQQLGGDDILIRNAIPTKLITITYNNETIEVYE